MHPRRPLMHKMGLTGEIELGSQSRARVNSARSAGPRCERGRVGGRGRRPPPPRAAVCDIIGTLYSHHAIKVVLFHLDRSCHAVRHSILHPVCAAGSTVAVKCHTATGPTIGNGPCSLAETTNRSNTEESEARTYSTTAVDALASLIRK